jgi:chaperonin GroES
MRISRGGEIRLRPGQWQRVNVNGEDLQKNFYPLPSKEPSAVLFQLLGLLIQAGEQVGSSTQTMKGENPGQNTSFKSLGEMQESGMQVFLGIYKRIYRSLTKEYRMLALLNGMYLAPDRYNNLLDEPPEQPAEGEPQMRPEQFMPNADFSPEGLDIVPQADPNLENSWRKKQRAQQLIEARNAGMPLNDKLLTRLYLEAMDEPDVEELMTVEKPPPSESELNHKVKMMELQLKEKELMMNAHLRQHEPIKEMAQAREALAKAQALGGEEQKAQLDLYIKQVEMQMKQAEQQQKAFLDMMLMSKKMEVEDAKVDAHRARTENTSRKDSSGD